MIVVSDTSPINALQKIGHLYLLPTIFERVVIPQAVHRELKNAAGYGLDLKEIEQADWLEMHPATNHLKILELQQILDPGESEAIALAQELQADFILIDEKEGRAVATKEGIQVIGVLGILLRAKETGLVDKVAPLMEQLVEQVGFWIAESTRQRILELSGEYG